MPKYSLFIQRRERISGSRIAKRDPDLIVHDPRSTGNNYFVIKSFSAGQTINVAHEKHKIRYLRTALFVKQFVFVF